MGGGGGVVHRAGAVSCELSVACGAAGCSPLYNSAYTPAWLYVLSALKT